MSAAREEILGRIRAALPDVPPAERPDQVRVARGYRRRGQRSRSELVDLFTNRVRDYHAQVQTMERGEVGAGVERVCADQRLNRLAMPPGFPQDWRPRDRDLVEDGGLTGHELDHIDGALTGCAAAVAETGTIVLDGQRLSGRRILTLVPDHHICIVRSDQIVQLVPEMISVLVPAVQRQRVPVTLISGPSASSDIELERVEGVHGPRHLHVLVVSAT